MRKCANTCILLYIAIWGGRQSYMTLQPLLSEFPYIWGKFYFIFLSVYLGFSVLYSEDFFYLWYKHLFHSCVLICKCLWKHKQKEEKSFEPKTTFINVFLCRPPWGYSGSWAGPSWGPSHSACSSLSSTPRYKYTVKHVLMFVLLIFNALLPILRSVHSAVA